MTYDPVVADTNRYHRQLAEQEKIHEGCEKEVSEWNEFELVAYINESTFLTELYYQLIKSEIRYYEPRNEIDSLLIEMIDTQRIDFYWFLRIETRDNLISEVVDYMADKKIDELEND